MIRGWEEVRDGYRYENGYKVVLNGPKGGWWGPMTPEGNRIKRDGRVVHFGSETKAKAFVEDIQKQSLLLHFLEEQFNSILEKIDLLKSLRGPDPSQAQHQEERIRYLEEQAAALDEKIYRMEIER